MWEEGDSWLAAAGVWGLVPRLVAACCCWRVDTVDTVDSGHTLTRDKSTSDQPDTFKYRDTLTSTMSPTVSQRTWASWPPLQSFRMGKTWQIVDAKDVCEYHFDQWVRKPSNQHTLPCELAWDTTGQSKFTIEFNIYVMKKDGSFEAEAEWRLCSALISIDWNKCQISPWNL